MTAADFTAWRQSQGWTHPELTQLFGVTLGTLWRWERGRTPIPHAVSLLCALLQEPVPRRRILALCHFVPQPVGPPRGRRGGRRPAEKKVPHPPCI